MRSQDLVELALATARLPGVVYVTDRSEANLRWAANGLTTNGEMRSRALTVAATCPVPGGTAVGTVTGEVAGGADVAGIVGAAEDIARSGLPAEDATELVADYPHDDTWETEPAATDIEVLGDVATGLGRSFGALARRGRRLYGFAEHVVTTSYLGTSTGLRRRAVLPTGRLEVNAKNADGPGSAWDGLGTPDFAGVDVEAVVARLQTRLDWSAHRVDLPPGSYPTLLPPTAVADLVTYAYWVSAARDAEEGRTVFSAPGGTTRIGQRFATLPVRLWSDPADPRVPCTPFVLTSTSDSGATSVFDNGLPLAATDWIRDGQLVELPRSRAWAARTGQAPAPPADNLLMDAGGTASLDDLVATTERGLLLTCLWYIREVDPERLLLTGLTRDGVYLVEDGTVTAEVNNFRFNESPVELLARATEFGRAERTLPREWSDYFNRAVMPAMRVPDFAMSTVSQAS